MLFNGRKEEDVEVQRKRGREGGGEGEAKIEGRWQAPCHGQSRLQRRERSGLSLQVSNQTNSNGGGQVTRAGRDRETTRYSKRDIETTHRLTEYLIDRLTTA